MWSGRGAASGSGEPSASSRTENNVATTGSPIRFSRLLLYFDYQHEKDFLAQLNSQRRRGIVDPTLFALSALFTLASIPHVVGAGHSEDVPLCLLCAIFGFAGAILHFQQDSAYARNLRIPLHLFLHMSTQILALRSLTYRDRVMCAGNRPFLEMFCLFSLFQSLYPTCAQVPLLYAIPSQMFFTATYVLRTPLMCKMGSEACSGSGEFYNNLTVMFSLLSLTLPCPPGLIQYSTLADNPLKACCADVAFISIILFLVIFFIVAVRVESRMRARYAAQKEDWQTMRALEERLPMRRILFWIYLISVLLWKVIDIVYLRTNYLDSYLKKLIN